MNIVVNGRFSRYKTGVGRVIENYLRQLSRIDDRNVYYIYVNREFRDLLRFENRNFVVLSNGVSAGNMWMNHLWTQTGFLRAIRKHGADLVLLPQINLILWKRAPILLFQHDLIEYHFASQKWYRMWFRRFAIPRAVRLADRIVSVSHNTAQDIEKFLEVPSEKVVTIYSGVDPEHLRPRDPAQAASLVRDRYGLQGEFILYVGTLTLPQKNLLRLLEAFQLVRERGFRGKLLMAGAMGKDSRLIPERVAELGLEHEVLLPGYVDDDDLPYLYSAARVFCFPSLYEGLGMPVLEAMACGCPVVTSNVSSLPEVAGDAARLVDPHDPRAIAEALMEILSSDQVRRELIGKGLERARQFSWERAARQLLEVINSFAP